MHGSGRRTAVAAAAAAAAFAGFAEPGGPTASGGNAVAFVSAEADDRLIAFQLSPGRVLRRIPVADGPHNVAASPRFVLVTSPPAGRVTLLDARRLRVLRVFRGFGYPHDVEFAPNGRYAYITDEQRGRVAVMSLATRRIVRSVAVDPRPHDLAVSASGRRVWVTHGPSRRTMTILDTARPVRARVARRLAAAGASHDIAFAPDGSRVWVTYWNANAVGAFDGRSGRLLFRVRVGRLPHHVAVEPVLEHGRVWITDHGGGHAFVLSARSGRTVRAFAVGPRPHHVAFAGSFAAVVSHDAGRLTVINTATGKLRYRSQRIGHGLHGIAVAVLP